MENTRFEFEDLKHAYLLDWMKNQETGAKLFPIEENIQGEDGTKGYRYLIFPCLNENLYKNIKVFNRELVAKNLESIFQTKYRTESKT